MIRTIFVVRLSEKQNQLVRSFKKNNFTLSKNDVYKQTNSAVKQLRDETHVTISSSFRKDEHQAKNFTHIKPKVF